MDMYGPKTAGVWGSPTSLVGPPGSPGSPGTPGANGNTVLNGVVPPTALDGVDGDFFIDTATATIYGPKAAGVWGVGTPLIGPIGPPGLTGPAGPPGTSGTYLKALPGDPNLVSVTSASDPTTVPAPGILYSINTTSGAYWAWRGDMPWAASVYSPGTYVSNVGNSYYTALGGTATVAPTHGSGTVTGVDGVDWTFVSTASRWEQLQAGYYIDVTDDLLYDMTPSGWVLTLAFAGSLSVHPIVTTGGTLTRLSSTMVVPYDSTVAAMTITLAAASEGDTILFKDISGTSDTNPVTIAAPGGVKLDAVVAGSFLMDSKFGSTSLSFVTFDTAPPTTPVTGWWREENGIGNQLISAISSATPLDRRPSQIVNVDSTGAAFTLTLPAAPVAEDVVHIKDVTGAAELNPVTLAAAAGFESTTPVLDAKYMALTLVYRGAKWIITEQYRDPVTAQVTINSATPLAVKRYQTILYDVSGGAFAITLPATPREGDVVRFKEKTGSTNALTVTGTIDGAPNPVYSIARLLTVAEYVGGAWRKTN
jgi:hypothetical protein